MGRLFQALAEQACRRPRAVALAGSDAGITYGELLPQVEALAASVPAERVGLALDNGPAWAVADLALLHRGAVCVPVPGFFSAAQRDHLLADAGVQAVLTDDPAPFLEREPCLRMESFTLTGETLHWLHRPDHGRVPPIPFGTVKITYTSGTTGEPRGVCLTTSLLEQVSVSLCTATAAVVDDRTLSLLPLSTLLENLAGVYVPLLAGGQCHLPGLAEVGMRGASGLDIPALLGSLQVHRPTGLVLIPQLLQVLVEAAEAGVALPDTLRFVAVGGAPVSGRLLERAAHCGIPVYEGYGLSEAGSVVCLNTPAARRTGTVGRPLPHVRLRIAADGEVLLGTPRFAGYLGDEPDSDSEWYATGDLGYRDEEGYLHLTGRRSQRFITSYGRNVAPEWVERELTTGRAIAQCAVFGEARPFNVAVIVPRNGATRAQIEADLERANARLPDYARVSRYLLADAAFSIANGQLTGTGRPRRGRIAQDYHRALAALYEEVA